MAIPDYQQLMLPLLFVLSDGGAHTLRTVTDQLGEQFHLTVDDLSELLPSGKKTKFYDRVGWASTYLRKAGILENPRRGVLHLTPRGQQVLQSKPASIDNSFLQQFAEFRDFRERAHQGKPPQDEPATTKATPLEQLEDLYQSLRTTLADELLDQVKKAPAPFFEQLVVQLLVAMGYGGSLHDAGQAVGQSGDDGIDGIIKEDKLGLDAVYIQAKRWTNTVGAPVVREFVGSLAGQKARKGVLITTSNFSKEATSYVNRVEQKVVLINGEQLAQYMIDYNIGVTVQETYVIKRVDIDYFE